MVTARLPKHTFYSATHIFALLTTARIVQHPWSKYSRFCCAYSFLCELRASHVSYLTVSSNVCNVSSAERAVARPHRCLRQSRHRLHGRLRRIQEWHDNLVEICGRFLHQSPQRPAPHSQIVVVKDGEEGHTCRTWRQCGYSMRCWRARHISHHIVANK